jgi:soluble lytic murein transglycosylase-like protein
MNTAALKTFAQQTRIKLRSLIATKMEYILTQDTAELRGFESQIQKLKNEITAKRRDLVVEEVAYTWFNRVMALRFMDANEYTSPRVVTPGAGQMRPAAQNQSLDDAWVYGLMRQESRFITSAKSNVGASGLMQLMPATAKWVARKIGLRDFSQGRVNDTETNVLLGTSYMRLVMENLDNHPVLASAAYNAGPEAVRKYDGVPPYAETQSHILKVMAVYDRILTEL